MNQPINSLCYSVGINSNSIEKLKELIKFPGILLAGLFKIKENVTPIFNPKRKVPFPVEASISKELDHLEQIDMLTKTDYKE